MSYFSSNKVEVFPSAWRSTRPDGKFTSENNFVNIINSLTDKESFVVNFDATNKILKVVMHGYYFEITLDSIPTDNLWLSIKIGKNSKALLAGDGSVSSDKYDTSDGFTAIEYSSSEPSASNASDTFTRYSFKAYDTDKGWSYIKYDSKAIDYAYYGSLTHSIEDDLNSRQYKLAGGDGIDTIGNTYSGTNTVKLTDSVLNQLNSLKSKGTDNKIIKFDANGVASNSTTTVGGYDGDNHLKFTGIYLSGGAITPGQTITISKANPSGGNTGDLWFKYTD